jgi:hypothetical protein
MKVTAGSKELERAGMALVARYSKAPTRNSSERAEKYQRTVQSKTQPLDREKNMLFLE